MPLNHVHKLLGYGLSNLKHDGKSFTDPRISSDGYLFSKAREDEYHLRHFFDILAQRQKKWYIELFSMEFHQPYISDCVHVLPKDGIIVLIPPDKANIWHRRDDIIDAIIEEEFFNRTTNCGEIKTNIPPYKLYMNAKTGVLLDSDEVEIFNDKSRRLVDDATSSRARKQLAISVDESAKRMGFRSSTEADLFIVPAVPDIIAEMAKWLKLFQKQETILELRPVTLAYWN